MSNLTFTEKRRFEQLLGMETGYVLDFTNRTFAEFVRDSTGRDISLCIFGLLLTRGFLKKRIGVPSALKGNLQNPILPLLRIRGRPNEHKLVNDLANWGRLLYQKDAGAGTSVSEELAKVSRHGLEIV